MWRQPVCEKIRFSEMKRIENTNWMKLKWFAYLTKGGNVCNSFYANPRVMNSVNFAHLTSRTSRIIINRVSDEIRIQNLLNFFNESTNFIQFLIYFDEFLFDNKIHGIPGKIWVMKRGKKNYAECNIWDKRAQEEMKRRSGKKVFKVFDKRVAMVD